MSLIPYAAGELATAASPMLLSYGPTPAQVASTLYKDAKWAARRIQSAYRRRRTYRKKRRLDGTKKVGDPMKNIHMKREKTVNSIGLAHATRTLGEQNLTFIQGGDFENQRHRQIINCKGIQICYHLKNLEDFPVFFNVAIIAPKHNQIFVSASEFFRSNNGDRGTDFSDALTGLDFAYLPINTDRYNVLRHYRHQLGARVDSASINSDTGAANWMSRKVWLPVNRQLRFENQSTTSCTSPIYFVYWCDAMDATSGTAPNLAAVGISFMHTMFYTDVL